jgi:hypothetical protein
MLGLVTNRQVLAAVAILQATVDALQLKADAIMTEQADINAADAAIEGDLADSATRDAAILAAQQKLLATIAGLQGSGVNTAQLVADTAALLQAQGADDATVAALTAAAG